ncbi:DUF4252 domain-containing protein [Paraprevotella clara]|uniref:DUF4252 domain-containing protein n=1 Tax=Paraprevotella clara TaxID=454154 RepID=UPI0026771FC4|nr:DUF4252 domain-containing protein [Paraprevotella clara]
MKRRLIVLLAGLAYIMPAAAQQTLFDRYAEKQGVTYVNINGEIIKTLLPDMSNISIKEINILDIDNRQLLQSIDKDLQQCIKDEKYKQLIKTVDSDEKVCILKKEKSSDSPNAFLITVQSKEDTQLIWITGDMRKEDLEKLLKKL